MKKAMWLMIVGIGCVCAGCGIENETSSETVQIDIEEANAAYKDVIGQYLDEGYTNIGVSFIKIDDDDRYEMAIILGEAESDGAYLYTCEEDVAIQLKTDTEECFGRNGGFAYYPQKNIFESEYELMGMDGMTYHLRYFSMEDGDIVEKDELEIQSTFDSDDKTYYVNGAEVVEAEYNAIQEKYSACGEREILQYQNCMHINNKIEE